MDKTNLDQDMDKQWIAQSKADPLPNKIIHQNSRCLSDGLWIIQDKKNFDRSNSFEAKKVFRGWAGL